MALHRRDLERPYHGRTRGLSSASQRTVNERRRAEVLERENADIRFAILKTQLNPHFLFNSLNVLSSLIGKDAGRAQHFVDEFSAVYRYILEVIDLPVVELRRELEFARSYLYLQSIRFADGIEVDVDIRSDQLDLYVPPLALQTVIENAFKHNRASADAPLHLRIAGKDGTAHRAERSPATHLQRRLYGGWTRRTCGSAMRT